MGIVAFCPNGHRIKVKDELAGRKGICPTCAARFRIPRLDAPAPPRGSAVAATDPPLARVVSLDPAAAASLPAARTITAAAAPAEPVVPLPDLDAGPDFLVVPDDEALPAVGVEPEAAGGSDWLVAEPAARPEPAALRERPELSWCIAVRGGAPSALLDAEALGRWLETGAATAEHVVWREDWPEWRPLAEVFPGVVPPAPGGWP